MAATGSMAKGSPEPESKLRTVARVDSVEEICAWLGTYGERLRMVRKHERDHVTPTNQGVEAGDVGVNAKLV